MTLTPTAPRTARYAPLFLITLVACNDSTDPPSVSAPACPPTHTTAVVSDLNYPNQNCAEAIAQAEGQLDSGHYRRACQAADDAAALPPTVFTARVTDCRTTDGRGVFVDVEVCCAESVEQTLEPESAIKAEGPSCPSWRTRARVNDLHYPDAGSCDVIVSRAEAELASTHYRNACMAAVPRATRPATVLEARVVECRSGGKTRGVTLDVELCCEAKVFEESVFRELVMRRSPDEIRAALGAPQQIDEQPQGTHWSYPVDVAREDRIFAGVTLVFLDGRVNSYFF